MRLISVGFGQFRSIPKEYVWIDLDKRLNLITGRNISGKSNILHGLQWISQFRHNIANLCSMDYHFRDQKNGIKVALKAVVELEDDILIAPGETVIFAYEYFENGKLLWTSNPFEEFNFEQLNELSKKVTQRFFPRRPGDEQLLQKSNEICQILFSRLLDQLPEVIFLPGFRQIAAGTGCSMDGQGIAEELAKWQHPDIEKEGQSQRFLNLQKHLRKLMNLPNLEIEILYRGDQIVIKNKGLRLPLHYFGAGIHQLILLLIAVCSHDYFLICIEEPEIHLHPLLQNRLINFLLNETTNKYVISTHSAQFMAPGEDCAIINLSMEQNSTKAIPVKLKKETVLLIEDLGLRMGDLLMSNMTIWIKSFSDRIFIKRWIELSNWNLSEGLDYQFCMFGSLVDTDDVRHPSYSRIFTAFLDLVDVGCNAAIVINSCKKKPGEKTAVPLRKFNKECQAKDVYCWITEGRSIENYVSEKAVALAYENEICGLKKNITIKKFDDLEQRLKQTFRKQWQSNFSFKDNRFAIARLICKYMTADQMDTRLKKHIKQIISRMN